MLRGHLSLLGSLQEILSGCRLPGAPSRPGPLQSAVELLGQSGVVLRFCGQLLVALAWVSAGRLTMSGEPCFRRGILGYLGMELSRGATRSTGSKTKEYEL